MSRLRCSTSTAQAATLFEGIAPHHWMGRRRNVYCVDFSVGRRSAERARGGDPNYVGKLSALRMPEWEVMHDDGSTWDIAQPA